MKLLTLLFCSVTACSLQADEPPETYIPSRYYDLWRNSPFTDPPPEEEEETVKNDLEDWVLMGVQKYQDRQVVTVVNSKDRTQRIKIPSTDANDLGFAILEVKVARSFLNTEVHLQKGPHRGWVQYNPKFLVVKPVAGPTRNSKNPKANGKQPPRPGSTIQGKPPIPGSTRPSSKSTGRSTTPPAPGSKPKTGSTGTSGTTAAPKKTRLRYVPRPK